MTHNRHFMKMLFLLLALALAVAPCTAVAKGGSKGGGSGGSKVSGGGSKPSNSGGSKVSGGGSKPKPTIGKPSTGSKPQPVPVTRMIPLTPPAKLTGSTGRAKFQPAGRDYTRDRRMVSRNPAYQDPYGASYFGTFNSPFFYLWLFAIMDDDESNNPLPPESDDLVGASILSYMQVIQAMQELSAGK